MAAAARCLALALVAVLPIGAHSRRIKLASVAQRDRSAKDASLVAASQNASIAPPRYNEAEAVTFAHYARLSYCEDCVIRAWTCGSSCGAVSVNALRLIGPGRRSHVSGFVGELPQRAADGSVRCVVSFRGSENLMNWMTNLNFMPRAWEAGGACRGGCRVHAGFADAWDELEPQVWRALSDLGCKSTAVTGHSLGGAIATLAAFRIRTNRRIPADPVYTFGSPRVGNQMFAERFKEAAGATNPPAWRIIHYKDPVPRIPYDRVLGFRHHPVEVYYTKNERQFTVCSSSIGEDASCMATDQPILVGTNALLYHAVYMGLNFNPLTRSPRCALCVTRHIGGRGSSSGGVNGATEDYEGSDEDTFPPPPRDDSVDPDEPEEEINNVTSFLEVAQAVTVHAHNTSDVIVEDGNASSSLVAVAQNPGTTPVYNESEATVFAHYARIAYCEDCVVRFTWACGTSCNAVKVNALRLIGPGRWSRVTGYVGEMPQRAADGSKRCVVSFAGSSNLWHWATNLNFLPRAWEAGGACRGGCRVHSGFADAWDEVEPEVFRALDDLGCQSTAVTGHSLGGAIATLAAFRIRSRHGMVADPVYLFGAPRVGNQVFAERFYDNAGATAPPAWRIVHYKDPVPRMPFDTVLGFRHHPTEVYYAKNERSFKVCSHDLGEDRDCAGQDTPILMLRSMLNYHAVYMGMNFNPLTRELRCSLCVTRHFGSSSLEEEAGNASAALLEGPAA